MSKFMQDTESIERLLDHIESKMIINNAEYSDNQNDNQMPDGRDVNRANTQGIVRYNHIKENGFNRPYIIDQNNRYRSVSNHEITDLFKKIMEADSTYKYVDMSEILVMDRHNESAYGTNTQKNIYSVPDIEGDNDNMKNISSMLDMIDELSESIKHIPSTDATNKHLFHKDSAHTSFMFPTPNPIFIKSSSGLLNTKSMYDNHTKYGLSDVFITLPIKPNTIAPTRSYKGPKTTSARSNAVV
jgi:hypothetical protein